MYGSNRKRLQRSCHAHNSADHWLSPNNIPYDAFVGTKLRNQSI